MTGREAAVELSVENFRQTSYDQRATYEINRVREVPNRSNGHAVERISIDGGARHRLRAAGFYGNSERG